MQNDSWEPYWRKIAHKWGVDDTEAVQHFAPVVATYKAPTKEHRNTIQIFKFNQQYGFCLWLSIKDAGYVYGPCPKFSEPYSSESLALESAILKIKRYLADPGHTQSTANRKLIEAITSWANSLVLPQQLTLF